MLCFALFKISPFLPCVCVGGTGASHEYLTLPLAFQVGSAVRIKGKHELRVVLPAQLSFAG